MRHARIKAEGAGYYHIVSRIIERRFIFDDKEKERFRKLIRKMEAFSGAKVLTYTVMSNHFHILLHVPESRALSDDEFIARVGALYEKTLVKNLALEIEDYRKQGDDDAAEWVKSRYTYRMHDLSEFMKTLKQRYSQSINRRMGRKGPLWEDRYVSLLLEGSEYVLSTIAAYIDLNPVRAGMVSDPKDYRFSGYGEAMGGSAKAREGIHMVMTSLDCVGKWKKVRSEYRKHLFSAGEQKGLSVDGKPLRGGITQEHVDEVLRTGGVLSRGELLHCRVRYFSDGVVLGSRDFVEKAFGANRKKLGLTRKTGARVMSGVKLPGLVTMCDLRGAAITAAASAASP